MVLRSKSRDRPIKTGVALGNRQASRCIEAPLSRRDLASTGKKTSTPKVSEINEGGKGRDRRREREGDSCRELRGRPWCPTLLQVDLSYGEYPCTLGTSKQRVVALCNLRASATKPPPLSYTRYTATATVKGAAAGGAVTRARGAIDCEGSSSSAAATAEATHSRKSPAAVS